MTWTYDRSESTYSAVFPRSLVRIVVEGDEFARDEKDKEIAESEWLPLKEGRYYHFELEAVGGGYPPSAASCEAGAMRGAPTLPGGDKARLSAKSSFVVKAASHGSIAPGTAVGYGRLWLEGDEAPEAGLGVEVASEVVSYKKDYQDLLKQLTEDIADLQMQCSSCVQGMVKVDPHRAAKNDVQRFFFLLGLVGNSEFDLAIRQVVERPQVQLVEVEDEVDVRRMARLGRRELQQFASATRRIAVGSSGRSRVLSLPMDTIPERITSVRRIESVDTLENRFIKYALEYFLDRLIAFKRLLEGKKKDDSSMTVEVDLDAAVKMLQRWTNHEFFKSVGKLMAMPSGSTVLQRREGYREVLKKWLQFQAGTQLVWKNGEDVYAANQRKMSALYEYWCFFRLLKIVGKLFSVKTSEIAKTMIGIGSDGLSLKLKEGKSISLEGTFDSGRVGARFRRLAVEFSYNKTFSAKGKVASWTLPMRPDYTLAFRPLGMNPEIAIQNDLVTYVHFDAKYKAKNLEESLSRIGKSEDDESSAEDTAHEDDSTSRKDVKRVDILKMHAYRDAIKRTGGAYVLYPGTEAKIDRESGEILPGLGAFTLSPSHDSSDKIRGFLADVARHLCDRITRWEDYTYRTFQVYSQNHADWLQSRERTEQYLVVGDEEELRSAARQNLTENAAARYADPDQYFSHPFPDPRYEQAKWAYFKNLCVVEVGKFNRPDPSRIVMISAPWNPPLNFIVQRFAGTFSGGELKTAHPDCPVRLSAEQRYHLWEVRVINAAELERYMRGRGDL